LRERCEEGWGGETERTHESERSDREGEREECREGQKAERIGKGGM